MHICLEERVQQSPQHSKSNRALTYFADYLQTVLSNVFVYDLVLENGKREKHIATAANDTLVFLGRFEKQLSAAFCSISSMQF